MNDEFMNGGAPWRVVQVQREGVTLHDGEHEHAARVAPRLTQTLLAANDALAVGDWVEVAHNRWRECWVVARVPPRNQLARRGTHGERQVLVSNVDTVLIVMGLDADFNLRRLERCVALVGAAGVEGVVVLSKADLARDVPAALAAVRASLPSGMPAFALDGRCNTNRDSLAPWLGAGRTLVLLGSSGAGKSTLTNTLAGAAQAVGATREGDGRGRHTTTSRSLHRCEGGACIIDTPGLRTLRLDADEEALDVAFDDVAHWSVHCRFRDCRHGNEPGCAVREHVAPQRLRHFLKLQREVRRDTMTVLDRQAQLREWKRRSRGARQRSRDKLGG